MKLRLVALTVVVALALVACGGEQTDSRVPPPTPADSADRATTTGADAPTARPPESAFRRNAREANEFVGGGRPALEARLAALKGHPVVVNLWASWCAPCRFEFPFFAAAVKRHGAGVAFVGVDVMDRPWSARAFVKEQPPGFPSITDRRGTAARSLSAQGGLPKTIFFDRAGRKVHVKLGGYARAAQLEADIRRYALGKR